MIAERRFAGGARLAAYFMLSADQICIAGGHVVALGDKYRSYLVAELPKAVGQVRL